MIRLRAPGRICLFGEHQDYLGFPIIAMAISKYIYLEANEVSSKKLIIEMPDINAILEIKLNNKELEYQSKRDYLRSGYNHFIRRKIKFKKGYNVKITGDLPMNAGVSSSSALVMAWLSFLNIISKKPIKKKSDLALEGFHAEVKEFKEGGGMMDHYTSIYGNILYLEPVLPRPSFMPTNIQLEGFILGNSLEKKDTVDDLIRTKQIAMEAFNILEEIMPDFDPFTTSFDDIKSFLSNLEKRYQKKIIGNIKNRDITQKARKLIFENFPHDFNNNEKIRSNFYQQLGTLLNEHHHQLNKNIGITTPKIDKMISNCLDAGALGAKINGSGFGGTMFAVSLKKEDIVMRKIDEAGGEAFKITTSAGVEQY